MEIRRSAEDEIAYLDRRANCKNKILLHRRALAAMGDGEALRGGRRSSEVEKRAAEEKKVELNDERKGGTGRG